MSADSPMSCERCQDLLTELVCDELAVADAAAVRAHAQGCQRCGPVLSKFERTLEVSLALPLLTPAPEVEKRIMQAARGALQSRAKGPLREAPEAPRSGFLAWCARVGSWAMSPQVAMASVLLLVVGIGLYALPLGPGDEVGGLRASEEPSSPPMSPEPAATASAAPTPEPTASDELDRLQPPATPEEHKPAAKSARARREAPGEAREQGAKKGSGALADEAKNQAPAKPKAAPAPFAKAADDQAAFGERSRASEGRAQLNEESASARPADARGARKQDLALESEHAAGGGFAPPPPAAAAPAASAPAGPAQALGAASQSDGARARDKQRAPSAAQAESSAQAASGLGQGIAAAQRGDLGTAQKLLTPIAQQGAQPERAQASLWLARSLRAAGDCTRALVYYKPLAEAAGASRAVLDEAADCYERTGSGAQAKRLRARAMPSAEPASTKE